MGLAQRSGLRIVEGRPGNLDLEWLDDSARNRDETATIARAVKTGLQSGISQLYKLFKNPGFLVFLVRFKRSRTMSGKRSSEATTAECSLLLQP